MILPDSCRDGFPSVRNELQGVTVASGNTVLFIAGMGRSGSTLLDRVLGRVPSAVSIGEASQVWRGLVRGNRCGCGRFLRQCPFWTLVMELAFGGWRELDVDEALRLQHSVDRTRFIAALASPRRPEAFQRRLDAYVSFLSRLYAGIKQASGAELTIDSGKHTSTAYLLRHVPGVRPLVLHLVRDSRGVAYSWTKTVRKSAHADAGEMDRLPPGRTAEQWILHNALLHGLPHAGVPTLRLRYEDFATHPDHRLAEILAFAGLDPRLCAAPFLPDGRVDLSQGDHTLAGNPMRFRREAVRIRADESWRQELPTAQRRLVTSLTAPLLFGYGYPIRLRPDAR